MASKSFRHSSIEPTHPGGMLAQIVIPATGKSKKEIAALLHLSRQTLYAILACKQPVTLAVAVRLGKLFGNGPMLWARMQTTYDIWHAERAANLPNITQLETA